MTDYLIELIFTNIQTERIGRILKELSCEGKEVIDYNCSCSCPKISWKDEKLLQKIFMRDTEFILFINLKELSRAGISLPLCGLMIYKLESTIQLGINFELSDLQIKKGQDLTQELMALSESIANQYELKEYFCGIEPAEDEETRLFTNNIPGPIRLEGYTARQQ